MSHQIHCPYCDTQLTVQVKFNNGTSQRIICDRCKQPIMLYRTAAEALQHRDRGTKATSLEETEFDNTAVYLEIIETEFTKPQKIELPEGKSLFGRYNPKSSAQLQILTADPSIDRQHSYFIRSKNGRVEVMDNDSMTGTFVNGREIDQGERRRLHDGDVLTFGATTAIVHLPDDEDEDDYLDF
ncbi:MAG: FHA domain-containing protein [Porphyromonas sp.]|nr:FHA domain-containing protein [Porphyromonas sp.]